MSREVRILIISLLGGCSIFFITNLLIYVNYASNKIPVAAIIINSYNNSMALVIWLCLVINHIFAAVVSASLVVDFLQGVISNTGLLDINHFLLLI